MARDGDGAVAQRLERCMALVGEGGYDGWLIADFRWNNPLVARLLGLSSGVLSRRCFLWLPAPGRGEPRVLVSQVDGHTVAGVDCAVSRYAGYEDMVELLRALMPAGTRVAMEYVEHGLLPTISRVDAGLVELIREWGVTVVSSGLLIGALEVWDERQRALHERAARVVDAARRLALERTAEQLRRGDRVTEGSVVALIKEVFAAEGVTTADDPDVAVNGNAADPHYGVGGGEGALITPNSVLLIDLFGKVRDAAEAPYADSTWMAYIGSEPPADLLQAMDVVRTARDAAIDAVTDAVRGGKTISGRQVDLVARASVAAAGMSAHLAHRTGHSLGTDHIHGMGTNLDGVEFPDDRLLLLWSGFTVEPGLYLPGQFGVRLEVSAILGPDGPQVTTETQTELTLLRVS